MSPFKSFFVGVIFGAAVTGTIAVLCILAIKQAAEEESKRRSKKVPIEHDDTHWQLHKGDKYLTKARFKRRTLHVPNPVQISENNRFSSFALDSVHVNFEVCNGPK